MQRSVDVAVIGGGLAANLLARQLRRQVPRASVAVFERETERSWKVGESTVEIAANYLVRRLGLSTYLYDRHLPKNGLRFFFDTADRDAPLTEMSEIGLKGLPPYPSFQLDRARLEADLIEMNRTDGVDYHVGARVASVALDGEGGHRLRVVDGEGEEGGVAAERPGTPQGNDWTARWVVDCGGRGGILSRQLDLKVPERSHRIAAAWGRVRDLIDMDDLDAPEWRARVQHGPRSLSTNHFCYPGEWQWLIPLGEGVTSIGVVMESSRWSRSMHRPEGLLAHMKRSRSLRDLLEPAELLDHMFLTQLAFRTRRFFGAERWAVVGDAAAFVDPFYSPGSDFIAIENDLVADLIERDLAGEGVDERVEAYDQLMHFRFDVAMLLYEGLYPTFGSFELMKAKVWFDCACYYNLWFDSYARDEHLDLKKVEGTLRRKGPVFEVMRRFADAFRRTAETLEARGDYHRGNLGRAVHDPHEAYGPIADVGAPRKRPRIDRRTEEIFNGTLAMLEDLVGAEPKQSSRARRLFEFAEDPALFALGGAA